MSHCLPLPHMVKGSDAGGGGGGGGGGGAPPTSWAQLAGKGVEKKKKKRQGMKKEGEETLPRSLLQSCRRRRRRRRSKRRRKHRNYRSESTLGNTSVQTCECVRACAAHVQSSPLCLSCPPLPAPCLSSSAYTLDEKNRTEPIMLGIPPRRRCSTVSASVDRRSGC